MELLFIFLSLVLFIISIKLATISSLAQKIKAKFSIADHQNLPPGSLGWPLFGETFQFISAHQKGAFEDFVIHRTKKYSSQVFKTSFLGENMVIFSGTDANKFIFSNEEKYFNRWRPRAVQKLFPSTEYVTSQHDHKKGKMYVSLLFKNDTRKKLMATIDSIARHQLHDHCQKGGVEIIKVYSVANTYTFAIACKLFMSIDDPNELTMLLHHFNDLSEGLITLPINFPGTLFHHASKAKQVLRKKIGLIIKERRREVAANLVSPHQDILTNMLVVPDDNGQFMIELEVIDKIMGLIIGGYHTTSSTITFAIKYLAEMPHLYDQVMKEQREILGSMEGEEVLGWNATQKMKRTSDFVNEVLRHTTIVQVAFREAITDFTYKGFTIPKGWKICWSPASTQKNTKYFAQPQTFDPSRFEGDGASPYTFVPFGAGPRMCPGHELSKTMTLVFLHHWLKMFNWEAILPHEKLKINVSPIPIHGFPVRIFPLKN